MTPDEIRELWSRFLAGEDLLVDEQRALVDALDADPGLRESLLENLQLDGALRGMAATRSHGEDFVRNLSECLGPEHDATRFIQKVELRLKDPEPPPPSGSGSWRRTKKSTTRIFRRLSAPSQGETDWRPALIAAAIFTAILLGVTISGSPSSTPKIVRSSKPPVQEAPIVPPMAPPSETVKNDPAPVPPRVETPAPEPKPAILPKPVVPAPEDPPKPVVVAPKEPAPEPRAPKAETVAKTPENRTRFERVTGYVYKVRVQTDKQPARKDELLPLNWDVETPTATSSALLRFDDGTWVEVGPNSSFRETAGAEAPGGRRVVLNYGTLLSNIAKQPSDRPMVFATPYAEATILGTTVRLTVSHDPKNGSTTLEVKEGKVLLMRLADKKSIEVTTGQFAIAAAGGVDMAAQRTFPEEFLIKFGPADLKVKSGQYLDSGEEFDAARGYGWLGKKNGDPIPGLFWRDPAGQLQPKTKGRLAVRRQVPPGLAAQNIDPLKLTDVTAGWAGHAETWVMPIPNGRYLVSVCCGDISFEQGPHHVSVEGFQIINQIKNQTGKFVEAKDVPVEVKDGELTMRVGGYAGSKVSSDGSSDTLINFLIVRKLKK